MYFIYTLLFPRNCDVSQRCLFHGLLIKLTSHVIMYFKIDACKVKRSCWGRRDEDACRVKALTLWVELLFWQWSWQWLLCFVWFFPLASLAVCCSLSTLSCSLTQTSLHPWERRCTFVNPDVKGQCWFREERLKCAENSQQEKEVLLWESICSSL